MRGPQRAQYGGRRYRIRRRHYRAERDRHRPRHRWNQPVRHESDSGGREPDREDDQASDRGPVVPEVPERRVVRRIEQHGRDEERQRKLRRDREGGRAGKKREQRTPQRQEYRIRRSDAACQGCEDHGRDEQDQKFFELVHTTRYWAIRACSQVNRVITSNPTVSKRVMRSSVSFTSCKAIWRVTSRAGWSFLVSHEREQLGIPRVGIAERAHHFPFHHQEHVHRHRDLAAFLL
jgi:hypothetical protein